MKLVKNIQWLPFSQKHKNYIKNAFNYNFNVAEGAVRSGKTIDNCIIAAMFLETCQDKLHLATGSSLPNAKLNIGECNGFGLEHLFAGRSRWGKFKSNEALYIQTQTGEKIIIFAGGGKADSYKHILGNSYGLWIATEINEHFDSEDSRTSFIKVAMARQLASKEPFTLWDLNPCNPHDSIYVNYIDKYMGESFYHWEHFNIFDNAAINEERQQEIISKYNPNSIWYQRDILGKRAVTEGIIFRNFADNPKPYLFDEKLLYEYKNKFSHLIIGIDFGDNKSKYSFTTTGFLNGYNNLFVLSEKDIAKSNSIDSKKLCDTFINYYTEIIDTWGYPDFIFCDSASNTLINTLRTAAKESGLPSNRIYPVVKNKVQERPKTIDSLLSNNRLKINKNCKNLINALKSLAWDKKIPDTPEDNNINNINDYYDSFCYTFITHTQYIELGRNT